MNLSKTCIDNLTEDFKDNLKKGKKYRIAEIDDLENIDYYKNEGAVYFIYATKNGISRVRYIGKSKGNSLKTRLKAHFFNIGKGTVSRNQTISDYRKNGCKFHVKIVWTNPQSLRNLMEEIFIDYYRKTEDLWNGKRLLTTKYIANDWKQHK